MFCHPLHFCLSLVIWRGVVTVASFGQSLSVCMCVCVCVFGSNSKKAESNKLAEMVPSELHDWSIEFHHEYWPVGLNGLPWVTRLKHHTAFISLLIGLSPETWTIHSHCSQHLYTSVCMCVFLSVWSQKWKRDYDQGVRFLENKWKRVCVLKRYSEVL